MGADGDDEVVVAAVEGGEVVLEEAEGLAEAALDQVAGDGAADASSDAEAEAWAGGVSGEGVDDDGAGARGDPGAVDGLELSRVGQAVAPAEPEPFSVGDHGGG